MSKHDKQYTVQPVTVDEFKRQAMLVMDRKTGELYDPKEAFDKLMDTPEVMASLKRLAVK
jgi:hypothetical protein